MDDAMRNNLARFISAERRDHGTSGRIHELASIESDVRRRLEEAEHYILCTIGYAEGDEGVSDRAFVDIRRMLEVAREAIATIIGD